MTVILRKVVFSIFAIVALTATLSGPMQQAQQGRRLRSHSGFTWCTTKKCWEWETGYVTEAEAED